MIKKYLEMMVVTTVVVAVIFRAQPVRKIVTGA